MKFKITNRTGFNRSLFNNGFTLIELILVFSILVILAVAVLPNVFGLLVNLDLKAVNSRILHDINYAQNHAVTQHTNTWIEFDQGNGRYTLYAGADLNSRQPLKDFSEEFVGTVPLRALYNDVQITGLNFNNGSVLSFDWWGTPSSGGFIVLNNFYLINVSKETGYAY